MKSNPVVTFFARKSHKIERVAGFDMSPDSWIVAIYTSLKSPDYKMLNVETEIGVVLAVFAEYVESITTSETYPFMYVNITLKPATINYPKK